MSDDDPILQRVQKLVDKAWSTTFTAERDSLLAKAEALMLKYSLDQFKLLDPNRPQTAAPIKGQDPELRTIWYFGEGTYVNYEVATPIWQMFYALARHLQCRIGVDRSDYAKVVGYPADLDFLEMMFLSLKLHLLSKVDPHVTSDLSWEQNLIAFKQAGFKWQDIHLKLQNHPFYPYHNQVWQRNMGVRFTAVYKRYRDANPNEPANTGNPAVWRRDFIEAYVMEIGDRLRRMRHAALEENRLLPALLNDKGNALERYFMELFPPPPPYIPPPPDPNAKPPKPMRYRAPKYVAMSHAAMAAGRSAAQTADLNQRGARVGSARERAIEQ